VTGRASGLQKSYFTFGGLWELPYTVVGRFPMPNQPFSPQRFHWSNPWLCFQLVCLKFDDFLNLVIMPVSLHVVLLINYIRYNVVLAFIVTFYLLCC